MKLIKRIISLIMILCFGVLLTACNKKETKASIVGSWETSGYTYTFNSDKTGSYKYGETVMKFTYEDDGKKVSILYTGNTAPSSYEYKIDGKKLTIKDSFGKDVVYTKK